MRDRVRQHDQGRRAGLLARGAELDPDAVPVGQPADHEQAHALRDRGVHGRRVRQLVVDVREVLGGQTDALVVDLDHHAAVGETGRGDADLGLRGGERGGVLQQLGQQVHEVGDRAAVDLGLRHTRQLDALVLLHLGGGGAQHVDERHGLVPAAAGLLAGEDQEVLAVAAHTGGQVVQLEEVLQLVGVGLVVLQVGDQGELALDQRLIAAREVGEDRVDVAPQQGLLGGEPDRLAVDLVEGAGDLADLVLGGDRDRRDPGVDPAGVGAGKLVDEHGQPLLGDAEGGVAQPAHRAAHLAGHQTGQEERGQQGDDDHGTGDERRGLGVVGDGRGLVHRLVGHVRLDLAVGLVLQRVDRPPVVGGDAARGELVTGERAGVLHGGDQGHHLGRVGGRGDVVRVARLGLLDHAGGVRLDLLFRVAQLLRVDLGATAEVLLTGDALQVGVRGQGDPLGREVRRVRTGLDQQVGADRPLQRQRRLGQRDGVDGTAVGGDVSGAQTEFVGELHQGVTDLDVALFGLYAGRPGGVRDLPQLRQLGLRLAEQLQPALQARGGGHALRRLVEDVGGLVRGLAGVVDDRLAVGVLLVQQQWCRGDVALALQRVGVGEGGAHETGGVLGVAGLLPGVDRALHLEAAHDETDGHGYEQDRVQPVGTRQFRGERRPPLGAGVASGSAPGTGVGAAARGGGVKLPRADGSGPFLLRLTRPTTSRRSAPTSCRSLSEPGSPSTTSTYSVRTQYDFDHWAVQAFQHVDQCTSKQWKPGGGAVVSAR